MTNDRLSPNQSLTLKFPVVGEREPAPFTPAEWRLSVDGLVRTRLQLSLEDFLRLPAVERSWDTICVTGWTHLDHRWTGVPLSTLLNQAGPLRDARFVRFAAYSRRKHDTSLPLDYALEHVILAHAVDGAPLDRAHGGPVRSVCHGKYFYKSLKWLRQIELLAEDRLGFWERTSAYHNHADPWAEERYDPRPMDGAEFARRIAAKDFSDCAAIMDDKFAQWRGVDLSGLNLRGAQIKACELSGALLRGADARSANFTRSTFTGADLRDADLSNADLEGADLRGADLRGADLRGAFLTVAQFAHLYRPARVDGAHFRRVDIENEGLDDAERRFLLDPAQGALIE
ncbi:MAG: molybdopterin-dependent oxidoreductase [Chloroflexi bacterium]|nr:molybdopterin-dependent oxidoreductase [Chloroflexota bacterium]